MSESDEVEPAAAGAPPAGEEVETELQRRERERPSADYAAAIYGTVVVAGVIASSEYNAADTVYAVVATALVFYVAHVWANAMAERIDDPDGFDRRHLLAIMRREWPMVQAAALPLIPLLLAWAGVFSELVGSDIAVAISVLELFSWGLVVGRSAFQSWPHALLSGLLNGGLGVLIVVLKVLLH